MEAQTGEPTTGVPGPLKSILAFHRDPLGFLTQMGRQGGLVKVSMGRRPIYLVNDPELVRQVLAADQQAFIKGKTMRAAKPIFGDGLLRSEGDLHTRQRRLIQPLFHRQRIHEYAPAMVQAADARQRHWREGDRLDLADEMRVLTIDVIGRSLFSAEFAADAERLSEAVGSAVGFTKLLGLPGFGVLRRLPLTSVRRVNRANSLFDDVFGRLLREHGGKANGKDDLLSALLDPAACGASDAGLRQVRDEAVTMLLAGHVTVATTLGLAWALLDTHPEALDRFDAELDSVLGGRLPTAEDLPRLPYTEAVIKESWRLYPPSWTISRVTTQDYELAGERIPVGSALMVSQWIIHRNPDLYEDPTAFKPERWIDGSTAELPKYAFFPFGGGPRKCVGEGFARTEAILIMATIGSRWSMRLSRRSIEVEPQFTLQPKGGVPVTLQRRDRAVPSGRGSSSAGKALASRGNGETYWDEIAPIWEQGREQRLWRRHSDAVNRRLVSRWLPEDTHAVLKTDLWDEAMGEGLYPALAVNGNEVTGIDISESILASARDRYPRLEAHRADVRSLPFPDRRFDAVVSNSSLDHFASRDEILLALRELRRVMKPGGRLLLTLDNPGNPLVGLTKALPRRLLNRLWLRWGRASQQLGLLPYYVGATYGRGRLRQVLIAEGFAVEEMTTIVHAPRPFAVALGHLLERRARPALQERYLRWLMSWERMSGSPMRYLSGNFVAVRARKL
jgi:cytochrome P450/SAM-dependent methyltransferase